VNVLQASIPTVSFQSTDPLPEISLDFSSDKWPEKLFLALVCYWCQEKPVSDISTQKIKHFILLSTPQSLPTLSIQDHY